MRIVISLATLLLALPAYAGEHSAFTNADKELLLEEKIAFKEALLAEKEKESLFNKHAPAPVTPYTSPKVANLQSSDIVAIAGDSITQLGAQPGQWLSAWQAQVNAIDPTIRFVNCGVAGNTSSDLEARFTSTVLNNNPTVVIIFIGVNDAQHSVPNYALFQSNIITMIRQARTVPFVREVVLMTPFCFGEKYEGRNLKDGELDTLAAIDANIGSAYSCPVINLRAVWAYSEAAYNRFDAAAGVFTSDGVHPNGNGAGLLETTMIQSFGE